MYIKRIFPVKLVLKWTRREIFLFLLLATVPVFLFDFVGLKWLHVPWLPLGVLGTAISFLISFKNNASYDRLWEARKIWGAIVNSSRSWGAYVRGFISNQFITENSPATELQKLNKKLIYRPIAWL